MTNHTEILRQLSESQVYRDYAEAFLGVTQLPLSLRSHEGWRHAGAGIKHQHAFCQLMAQSHRNCAACLEMQGKSPGEAPEKDEAVTCFAGLSDTSVPLRVGSEIIGFLQTGRVSLRKPSQAGFSRICRKLEEWNIQVDLVRLEEAYFGGEFLTQHRHASIIRLLEIFGHHLSAFAGQLLFRKSQEEPPVVARARQLIAERSGDDLSLEEMAKTLNVSTFYFCKLFRKATGLTFTDYLSRTRVEKARDLLRNPHLRISEIAYSCGFGSLGHFNRVFKKVVGLSPSGYRENLPS